MTRSPRRGPALSARSTVTAVSAVSTLSAVSLAALALAGPASATVATIVSVDLGPTATEGTAGWSVQGDGAKASINTDNRADFITQDGDLAVTPSATTPTFLSHDSVDGLSLAALGGLSFRASTTGTLPGFRLTLACTGAAGTNAVVLSGPGVSEADSGTAPAPTWTTVDAQGDDGPNGQVSSDGSLHPVYTADTFVEADGTTSATAQGSTGEWAAGSAHTYADWAKRCTGVITSYAIGWADPTGAAATQVDLLGWDQNQLTEFGTDQVPDHTLQTLDRQAGGNRIETAVLTSRYVWSDDRSAHAVVLATTGGYADGLGGGTLAAAAGGPLLLNPTATLDSTVRGEIARVLANGSTIYLAGGTSALSTGVESSLKAMTASGGVLAGRDIHVKRLPGVNRYDTARLVATEVLAVRHAADASLTGPDLVLAATGTNFPDALSASAAAANNNGVVLLTGTDKAGHVTVPTETRQFLAAHDVPVFAVGGSADKALTAGGIDALPVVGRDRYETSTMVGDLFFDALGYNTGGVVVASGEGAADALSGGAAAGTFGVPVVLVPSSHYSSSAVLPPWTTDFLAVRSDHLSWGLLMGGKSAVATAVEAAVNGLVDAK